MKAYIKGRCSQLNPANRFAKNTTEVYVEDLATQEEREDLLLENPTTKYIEVFPKTILNKVESPDVGLTYSMNPYQGCEHGCIYCYARNAHEYWGYSTGMEFEQNIMIKKSAHLLLRKTLEKKSWLASSVMLAGNTDIYQPAERKFGITRELLKVFLDFKHPVSMITKNSLIERDLDILKELAKENLVYVTMSLTTLNEKLKRVMEPRTSTAKNVLKSIERLTSEGIPVNVNVAPIIPGMNDEEIFDVVHAVADAGALSAGFIVVRLNGHNAILFEDWITKNFPDRANKVLNQIKSMHGGNLNDSNYGRRMKGEGKFAELIKSQFALAKRKYLNGRIMPPLNYLLYEARRNEILEAQEPQLKLF